MLRVSLGPGPPGARAQLRVWGPREAWGRGCGKEGEDPHKCLPSPPPGPGPSRAACKWAEESGGSPPSEPSPGNRTELSAVVHSVPPYGPHSRWCWGPDLACLQTLEPWTPGEEF